MKMKKQLESPFNQRIKKTLDKKVNDIPPQTLEEIRNIRKMALQKHITKVDFWQSLRNIVFSSTFNWEKSFGLVVTSVALLLLFFVSSPIQQIITPTLDDEFNQLALTPEEIDLYEKLEFYLWLQDFPEDHELLS